MLSNYKGRNKGKWSNPGRKSGALPYLRVVAIERGAFGLPPDLLTREIMALSRYY